MKLKLQLPRCKTLCPFKEPTPLKDIKRVMADTETLLIIYKGFSICGTIEDKGNRWDANFRIMKNSINGRSPIWKLKKTTSKVDANRMNVSILMLKQAQDFIDCQDDTLSR